MTPVDLLAELFAGPGAGEYLGEPVTIGAHMRQAGALAAAAGAAPALVAAALLHDVGHLRGETDTRHGEAGARWLSRWFGPAVTEPVRLHVAAKRYLCAAQPGYAGLLSAESVRTLARQGGPMTRRRGRRVHRAAVRAGRDRGAPLGRRGQGHRDHAARVLMVRAGAGRAGGRLRVRGRAGRACGR